MNSAFSCNVRLLVHLIPSLVTAPLILDSHDASLTFCCTATSVAHFIILLVVTIKPHILPSMYVNFYLSTYIIP